MFEHPDRVQVVSYDGTARAVEELEVALLLATERRKVLKVRPRISRRLGWVLAVGESLACFPPTDRVELLASLRAEAEAEVDRLIADGGLDCRVICEADRPFR